MLTGIGRRALALPKTSFPQLNSDLSHFYRTWDTAVEGYNVAIVTVSKAQRLCSGFDDDEYRNDHCHHHRGQDLKVRSLKGTRTYEKRK